MNLVTAAQMKIAEDAANARGFSYDEMMENAGRSVATAIDEQFGTAGIAILVLIGPGNNGGDGLVAARHLSDLGASVSLYIWKRKNLDDDPNWQRILDYGLPATFQSDDPNGEKLSALIDRNAIIVDALLGTGVARPIGGDLAEMLTLAQTAIENRRVPDAQTLLDPLSPVQPDEIGPVIVAVDVPSGLYADTGALDPLSLPADLTVTFAAPKLGLVKMPGALYAGHLLIADIGIADEDFPADLPQLATPTDISYLLPARPAFGHKGTFGKAMIISGSVNYTGAPALAANAAYRVGAGLVTLAIPDVIHPMVAASAIESTFVPLASDEGGIDAMASLQILDRLEGYSALLVGPGLGQKPATAHFLSELLIYLKDMNIPLILDADALNLLAEHQNWWELLPPAGAILTPHAGEMSRLTQIPIAEFEARKLELVPQMAKQWHATIIYKGANSVIANPNGDVTVLPFANPALATAGSGDVLAGSIAGLLAQGLEPFDAVVTGGYLHGLAGELARAQMGTAGITAGDLSPLLPMAIKSLTF